MYRFKFRKARDLEVPLLERASDIRRERGLLDSVVQPIAGAFVRASLATLFRLKITGSENLPAQPPYVLVANHTSHLDTLALLSSLPRRVQPAAYPLAAHDTFFTTPLRAMAAAKLINALPVRRGAADRQALATLRTRLIEDRSVLIIYPEGSRGTGNRVQPFLPGIGLLVAGTDVPVVPCRLRGCERAWPKGRLLPRPSKVELRIGSPRCYAALASSKASWQGIAEDLHASINSL